MEERIIAKLLRNSEVVAEVELSKENLTDLMNSIKKFYYNDNEVSSAISRYLPETKEILVNETVNKQTPDPYIYCVLNNGDKAGIKVRERHTVMWDIINSWFK